MVSSLLDELPCLINEADELMARLSHLMTLFKTSRKTSTDQDLATDVSREDFKQSLSPRHSLSLSGRNRSTEELRQTLEGIDMDAIVKFFARQFLTMQSMSFEKMNANLPTEDFERSALHTTSASVYQLMKRLHHWQQAAWESLTRFFADDNSSEAGVLTFDSHPQLTRLVLATVAKYVKMNLLWTSFSVIPGLLSLHSFLHNLQTLGDSRTDHHVREFVLHFGSAPLLAIQHDFQLQVAGNGASLAALALSCFERYEACHDLAKLRLQGVFDLESLVSGAYASHSCLPDLLNNAEVEDWVISVVLCVPHQLQSAETNGTSTSSSLSSFGSSRASMPLKKSMSALGKYALRNSGVNHRQRREVAHSHFLAEYYQMFLVNGDAEGIAYTIQELFTENESSPQLVEHAANFSKCWWFRDVVFERCVDQVLVPAPASSIGLLEVLSSLAEGRYILDELVDAEEAAQQAVRMTRQMDQMRASLVNQVELGLEAVVKRDVALQRDEISVSPEEKSEQVENKVTASNRKLSNFSRVQSSQVQRPSNAEVRLASPTSSVSRHNDSNIYAATIQEIQCFLRATQRLFGGCCYGSTDNDKIDPPRVAEKELQQWSLVDRVAWLFVSLVTRRCHPSPSTSMSSPSILASVRKNCFVLAPGISEELDPRDFTNHEALCHLVGLIGSTGVESVSSTVANLLVAQILRLRSSIEAEHAVLAFMDMALSGNTSADVILATAQVRALDDIATQLIQIGTAAFLLQLLHVHSPNATKDAWEARVAPRVLYELQQDPDRRATWTRLLPVACSSAFHSGVWKRTTYLSSVEATDTNAHMMGLAMARLLPAPHSSPSLHRCAVAALRRASTSLELLVTTATSVGGGETAGAHGSALGELDLALERLLPRALLVLHSAA
uniref:Uncharacterized protein n=1 Tax=Phytophthora ramorum TaxID=164328 RepID=H3HAT6_PHYRM